MFGGFWQSIAVYTFRPKKNGNPQSKVPDNGPAKPLIALYDELLVNDSPFPTTKLIVPEFPFVPSLVTEKVVLLVGQYKLEMFWHVSIPVVVGSKKKMTSEPRSMKLASS